MLSIRKWIYTYEIKILTKILNNTIYNMSLQFVIPGHYQSRSSESSDKKEIIRILGEDPNRANYWLTADKVSIPEYDILENWVNINTIPSEASKVKTPKKSLFEGLDFVFDEPPQQEINYEYKPSQISEIPVYRPKPINSNQEESEAHARPHIQPIFDKPQNPFIDELLSKLVKNNPINSDTQITISLNLNLGFDLNKLRNSIEILDLDKTEISKYIADKFITKDDLAKALIDQLSSIQDIKVNEMPEIVLPVIIPEVIIQSPINNKIMEVAESMDSKISEMLSKYTTKIL